jgi:hypothetical protein
MIGGSGPQLRDGSFDYGATDYFPTPLFRRPILEIEAVSLAKEGVATLRYDKRGSGKSGGHLPSSGFLDLVQDAEAAFDYIRELPEIDGARVGALGQSEGAVVAMILASERSDLAFYIWQSGFVDDFKSLAKYQTEQFKSMSPSDMQGMRKAAPYPYWETSSLETIIDAALSGEESITIGDNIWSLNLGLNYYRELIQLSPLDRLTKIRSPVLIIHGEADNIVPVVNAKNAHAALEKSGNSDVTLEILRDIGHSMNRIREDSESGGPPDEILPDPSAIKLVVSWVVRTVGTTNDH